MVNTHVAVYFLMTSLLMTCLALPTAESAPAPYGSPDRLTALRNLLKRLDDKDDSFLANDQGDDYSKKMAPVEHELPIDSEAYDYSAKGEELQKRGKKKKYRTICIDWSKGSWYWCWKSY
ncbi:uncharacterized protein LOC118423961 [Branchiostoma floridae]|uniref:Uncharacterized protein LOC118423961 n=1 Tax=Branchiostoma floridae TaxID=7739 RepID=A0A9J7N0G6_BRAFL|nr:uncharacterized protein LOC118423961 [Branchiostoma floridae]